VRLWLGHIEALFQEKSGIAAQLTSEQGALQRN
jgi:hypothetical protein